MQETLTMQAPLRQEVAAAAPAKPRKREIGAAAMTLGVTLLVVCAWAISRWGGYKAGSNTGYNLGLAGGIMLLLLFLYPLRKHFRFMHGFGPAKYWFAGHMTLGILGPLFILVHSNFHVGSINAGIALASMVLVAGSGIIGRFIYTRIHHGLYGRRANLKELRELAGLNSQEVESKLAFAPKVESDLTAFEAALATPHRDPLHSAWAFATLWLRGRVVYFHCARELTQLYTIHARKKNWDHAKHQHRLKAAKELVFAYVQGVQRVAQFNTYERLFSLWHVLHVPFVYMMVFSAIAHVVAVHMY
ncbi:MAG: hypothetical protein Q8K57_05405 [Thiobacillus sp.]|nr:hypothetical protein [Thiobacillus sp.]